MRLGCLNPSHWARLTVLHTAPEWFDHWATWAGRLLVSRLEIFSTIQQWNKMFFTIPQVCKSVKHLQSLLLAKYDYKNNQLKEISDFLNLIQIKILIFKNLFSIMI